MITSCSSARIAGHFQDYLAGTVVVYDDPVT
jgi:hypothetical protein